MNVILFKRPELFFNFCGHGTERASVFLERSDPRAAHLLTVLHKKEGDTFLAGLLGGKLGKGTVTEKTPSGLCIDLILDTEPPPRIPLYLGLGFPRPIQLRRLLRDCSAMGLAAIDLLCTELGEKSYRDTKLLNDGGALAALVEGACQARDTCLPALAVYPSLAAWLEALEADKVPDAVLIAADNIGPQGTFKSFAPAQALRTAVLAVGSERGWSDTERVMLENAGFARLSFGSRALRTETACIAAAALLIEKLTL